MRRENEANANCAAVVEQLKVSRENEREGGGSRNQVCRESVRDAKDALKKYFDESEGEDGSSGSPACTQAIKEFRQIANKSLQDCKDLVDDDPADCFGDLPKPEISKAEREKEKQKRKDAAKKAATAASNGERNGDKDKVKSLPELIMEVEKDQQEKMKAIDKEVADAFKTARAEDLQNDKSYIEHEDVRKKAELELADSRDLRIQACYDYAYKRFAGVKNKLTEMEAAINKAKANNRFRVANTNLASWKKKWLRQADQLQSRMMTNSYNECMNETVPEGMLASNMVRSKERALRAANERFEKQVFVLLKKRGYDAQTLNEAVSNASKARQELAASTAQQKAALQQQELKKQQEEQQEKLLDMYEALEDMMPASQRKCNPDFLKAVNDKVKEFRTSNNLLSRAKSACADATGCDGKPSQCKDLPSSSGTRSASARNMTPRASRRAASSTGRSQTRRQAPRARENLGERDSNWVPSTLGEQGFGHGQSDQSSGNIGR